ncbi:MAG: transglutaminase family protein [Crocinitomicaceae bacterium]|nr:transglutaminase family protein [Crocinitomicaceae bacterium]NGF76036.1 transglutaminase family protein [Fluviicola sp. SGL-29]
MENFLRETAYLNYSHPAFDEFLKETSLHGNETEQALQLYYLVRDSFLYDPFHLDLRPQSLIASGILTRKRAWCVEKAIVLAACARKQGIPSSLGYAIVVNHIGTDKLEKYLRKKEIVFHGYVSLFLDGKWVKCTPAFDQKVCRINKVSPLNWDGKTDSMFQEFEGNQQFMEYVHFYGEFDDVPVELMNSEMKKHYPHLFEEVYDSKEFSFFHM